MKTGTIIKLPNERVGTREDIVGNGNLTHGAEIAPANYDYFPDAMLRNPYPSADLECVGEEYEIISEAE